MDKNKKIFVAGGRGLVGSAICRSLRMKGYTNILTPSHSELDLICQSEVEAFFERERPAYVFLSAAKVGGIMANSTYRADFIYQNIMISSNIVHAAYCHGVEKLLFLGSTCIYPRDADQPMSEGELLTSPLEYTNEPYAIAKIAGIKMCESYNLQYGTNFLSVMPTNLYGPNDNFDLVGGHVLPAMMRKLHLAKLLKHGDTEAIERDFARRGVENRDLGYYGITKNPSGEVTVRLWGSGKPLREFLWSEDMADASVFVMENVDWKDVSSDMQEVRNAHINIGTGVEVTICELARMVAHGVGFDGLIEFDSTKPDGTMRKLTDPSKLSALGWSYSVRLNEGIDKLYNWYLNN